MLCIALLSIGVCCEGGGARTDGGVDGGGAHPDGAHTDGVDADGAHTDGVDADGAHADAANTGGAGMGGANTGGVNTGGAGTGGANTGGANTGGAGTGGANTGGANTGGAGTGGANTGGLHTGGAGTGGANTGGLHTGGAGTGGANTGGLHTGGAGTGGANTGGVHTGGAGTGGANTGGAGTGGANTGGANTGGANTGGANTGGMHTGGAGTGGANTGGAGTGGANTGGAGGVACANTIVKASSGNTAFTGFEGLQTPGMEFTKDGFDGKFFGDDESNPPSGSMFALTTTTVHSGAQAVGISTTTTGFVEIGIQFTAATGGCLDVRAFSGITFYARGAGVMTVHLQSTDTDYQFPTPLSGSYAPYTFTWADVGLSPAVLVGNPRDIFLLYVDGATKPTGAASLFVDDFAFTP